MRGQHTCRFPPGVDLLDRLEAQGVIGTDVELTAHLHNIDLPALRHDQLPSSPAVGERAIDGGRSSV